jgi:HSP20 family protein
MADRNETPQKDAGPGAQQTAGSSNQETNQPARRQRGSGAIAAPGYFPSPSEFLDNPFGVMRRMHEEMDRVFAHALGGSMLSGGESSGSSGGLGTWAPVIEVREQANNLMVCAELPGLKPDEVHVELNDNALVIHGERRSEQSSTGEGGVHRSERRYGRFYRTVPLPEGVNAEDAKATFNHGVLEVTVPLPQQQSRRREIPISGAGAEAATSKGGSSAKNEQTRNNPVSGPEDRHRGS